MLKTFRRILACGFWLTVAAALASCTANAGHPAARQVLTEPPVYDYPINNPYAATIIGLPPEMKADYSAVPVPKDKVITLFAGRVIPEGFWYQRGLRYSQLIQPRPAPLVYVIAGTGADGHSETMRILADILYTGGFSVVLLPSPTHPDFIINASAGYIAGRPAQDASDLYRAMKAIDRTITPASQVTGHMLIGYSLGALDAAFTAKLDDEEHDLQFGKVLLINPPLSLYSSMRVIDGMLFRGLPGGMNDAAHFLNVTVKRLSNVNQSSDALGFQNERLLLDAYKQYQPSDDRLATIIGLSFRLAAADMIFTTDVMTHAGYIFPKDEEFTTSTSLNSTLSVALRTSFRNYFDEIYTERFLASDSQLTRQALIDEAGLESIKGYLAAHPKIGLITNKDDVILAPGESAKLASLFGKNAVVYPNGGHLGNLGHPAVAYHIVRFLKQ